MPTRGIGAIALTASFLFEVLAERQPGILHRMSCTMVPEIYVARYSASTAEMWARSHGATEAQIEAARECLKVTPDETAQATSRFASATRGRNGAYASSSLKESDSAPTNHGVWAYIRLPLYP